LSHSFVKNRGISNMTPDSARPRRASSYALQRLIDY